MGVGAGAATIMKFWNMYVYSVVFLIGVDVVAVISMIGGDKGTGSVLPGGSFEYARD